MACVEHLCRNCRRQWMDNNILKECIYCKVENISNWFDELEAIDDKNMEDDDL